MAATAVAEGNRMRYQIGEGRTSPARRHALRSLSLLAASGALAARTQAQPATPTSARIVIVGSGAGGVSLANRLARTLAGAKVTERPPPTDGEDRCTRSC
jgi:hypothetical protein